MSQDAGYYHHGGGGALSAGSYVAIAGQLGTAALGTLQVVPDRIYAVPIIVSRASYIDRLAHRTTAVASGVIAQMAIYAVECATIPLPGRIISQDSNAAGNVGFTMRGYCSSLGGSTTNVVSVPQDYAIGGNRLLWMAATWTGSATVVSVADPWAIFGYDPVSLSVPYSHIVASWAGSVTMPNTYPAAWTAVYSQPPALGVRIISP